MVIINVFYMIDVRVFVWYVCKRNKIYKLCVVEDRFNDISNLFCYVYD